MATFTQRRAQVTGRKVGGARDAWLFTVNLRHIRRQLLALALTEYLNGCRVTLTLERRGPAPANVKNTPAEPETLPNGMGICATPGYTALELSSHPCVYLWGGSRRLRGSSVRRRLWFWSSGRYTATDIRTGPSAQNQGLSGGNDGNPGHAHFVRGDVGRRGLVTLLDRLPCKDHVDGAGVHQPGDVSVRAHWRHSSHRHQAASVAERHQAAESPHRLWCFWCLRRWPTPPALSSAAHTQK